MVVDTGPERARATAPAYAAVYLPLPNYLTLPKYLGNLRELGFSDSDFENRVHQRLLGAFPAVPMRFCLRGT
ncbi:hypothetical protein ACFC1R_18170 [Kitasatospora sp. NPDC056138]|uniref:hypothetical protein n=1 Tax=Kitasatospora sp. NPDC056138 TaxID=3345724 RepID=UPI0035E2D7DA